MVYNLTMLPQKALQELRDLFVYQYSMELSIERLKEEASDLLYVYAFSQGRENELPPLQEFDDD